MRGFDHAELLAEVVARHLELPCEGTLRRLPGPPQTGRTLAERRHGPHFEALTDLSGRSVVVVDDVVTTGATFRIAGSVMKSAGAGRVVHARVHAPSLMGLPCIHHPRLLGGLPSAGHRQSS